MKQRMAVESTLYRISAIQLKSAIMAEIKTFNNHSGFERGFCSIKRGVLWSCQKRGFLEPAMYRSDLRQRSAHLDRYRKLSLYARASFFDHIYQLLPRNPPHFAVGDMHGRKRWLHDGGQLDIVKTGN